MSSKKYLSVVVVILLLLLASCAKEGPNGATGPQGPAGPSYTGAIDGHVTLYDQYGSIILTGLSKVSVTLTNHGALNPDTTGYYLFTYDTTGVYTLTASDSGFGTNIISNISFINDTLDQDISLSAIPSYTPTALSYDTIGNGVNISFPADTRARECVVFVSDSPEVSNVPSGYLLAYKSVIASGQTTVNIPVPLQDLLNAGFTPEEKIYFRGYGAAYNDESVYKDQTTGKYVYNAVSDSSMLISGIVP